MQRPTPRITAIGLLQLLQGGIPRFQRPHEFVHRLRQHRPPRQFAMPQLAIRHSPPLFRFRIRQLPSVILASRRRDQARAATPFADNPRASRDFDLPLRLPTRLEPQMAVRHVVIIHIQRRPDSQSKLRDRPIQRPNETIPTRSNSARSNSSPLGISASPLPASSARCETEEQKGGAKPGRSSFLLRRYASHPTATRASASDSDPTAAKSKMPELPIRHKSTDQNSLPKIALTAPKITDRTASRGRHDQPDQEAQPIKPRIPILMFQSLTETANRR